MRMVLADCLLASLVCAPTWEYPHDDDCPVVEVKTQPHTPVTDAKTPFVGSFQPAHNDRWVAVEQAIEGSNHSPGHLSVEAVKILLSPRLEPDRPGGAVCHA